jgi:K+-sensing histidine kinase KdpD
MEEIIMKAMRILHLQNNPQEVEIINAELMKLGLNVESDLIKNQAEFLLAIETKQFDLILSSVHSLEFAGKIALELAQEKCPEIPFIFIDEQEINPREAIAYLQAGATDYLSKYELWKIPIILERNKLKYNQIYQEKKDDNHLKSMKMLVNVVQELFLAKNLEKITEIVVKFARELTGSDGAIFVLKADDQCYYAEENTLISLDKGQRFPINISLGGWCINHQEQMIIQDIYQEEKIPFSAHKHTLVKSLVIVPVKKETPLGVIGNYWAKKHLATTEEIALIQALADTTAVAIESVQLYQELEQRVSDYPTDRLRQLTAELVAANKDFQSFAYTVSHDLRNPLSIINGFAGLLKIKYSNSLDDKAKNYLTSIYEEGLRMNEQIDEILGFYRTTIAELKREKVNLSILAEEILFNFHDNDPERKVQTIVTENMLVNGDAILLKLALENMLNNAWKYTSKIAEAKIEFSYINDGKNTIFYIQDNGVGFDMNQAENLFTPFKRMHNNAEFSGTGLGLTSVQRVIHKHGGKIWAKSAINAGAIFYFTI